MAMAAHGGSMAPAMIYQEVKNWIAQQEAFEAQHNKPAPLTDVQRMALQALRLPSASSSPPPLATAEEPNYIGMLNERYQKSNQLGGLRWSEEAAGVLPGGVTGRVCRVSIVESLAHESGHIDHFPAVGYGLNDDGSEPHFTSKKAAKHFAAKCAVEWLSTHGLIASHLYGPSLFLKPSSHLPIAPAPSLKRAPQSTSSSTSSTSTPSPPKRQTMTSPQGLDGTLDATTTLTLSSPATELVATLCCELNISAPKYVLVEIAPNSKVFNGRAIFDDYGDSEILSLAEASVVQGVEGKDAAKKAIAAKVLARLREIEVARDAQLQLMIAQRMKDI